MLLSDKEKPSRLGVFFFFDKNGIVDDYVVTLLEGFRPYFTDLQIVCNGKLDDEGLQKLQCFTDKILVRPNEGFDVWAYKTAMDLYGWDKLVNFDEVVLFNATIMGPVYPFSEMFNEMDSRDLDFWGITKFGDVPFDPFGKSKDGMLHEHIQSHFHAYRKSLVSSEAFHEYWANIPPINSYADSVGLHESTFTKRFADQGFKWDVYVNTDEYKKFSYGPIIFAAKQLVADKRCPIFKRRSFFHEYSDVLDQSIGNASSDLYEYLRDHTSYDTDLIWQNILRTQTLSSIVKNLHLHYVLSSADEVEKLPDCKIALVAHIYYLELVDKLIRYVQAMPRGCDVFFTVVSKEAETLLREKTKTLPYNIAIRVIPNRGRDVAALLAGMGSDLMKYDYVCSIHDKKVTQIQPESVGDGFAYQCFENTLSSPGYVTRIINRFEQEPLLGVSMPPAPLHGAYFPVFSFPWGLNYDGTKDFLDELNMHVPLKVEEDVIAPLGTMFWFRPQALRGLLDKGWTFEDFPEEPNGLDGTILHFIERSYAYVAQHNGYYSAYAYSDKFAAIQLTNLEYTTRLLTRAIAKPWLRYDAKQTAWAIQSGWTFKPTLRRTIAAHLSQHRVLRKIFSHYIEHSRDNEQKFYNSEADNYGK